MTPTRKKRLTIVGAVILSVGAATAVALTALQDNLTFFVSPSDVYAQTMPDDRHLRLGGLVAEGSVSRDPQSMEVSFSVTDGAHTIPVTFIGLLPTLFREGQGVIAHGRLDNGVFHAREVLARHDETYMPNEVARALDAAGTPHQVSMPGTETKSSYNY
ncbi:MAG: cytochrome c maturation protein CcmE [Wenzhouxiangella sp.]|nr:MAG: cytochrome c maturation protein CcmE [Wenzhouxiangella sp.]